MHAYEQIFFLTIELCEHCQRTYRFPTLIVLFFVAKERPCLFELGAGFSSGVRKGVPSGGGQRCDEVGPDTPRELSTHPTAYEPTLWREE